MPLYTLVRLVLVFAAMLAVSGVISSTASSNTVQTSGILRMTTEITANTLKASQCSGLTLVGITAGSGAFSGSGGAALFLSSAGSDTLSAGVGTDVCYGGGQQDTFDSSCETTGP